MRSNNSVYFSQPYSSLHTQCPSEKIETKLFWVVDLDSNINNQMHLLLILLGCNIQSILLDRLWSSFRFIESRFGICPSPQSQTHPHITWFLSGGNKNGDTTESEAKILKFQIDNTPSLKPLANHTFVLDEDSTNTAENFVRASLYLNSSKTTYDDIFIITSDFHFLRAERLFRLIDPTRHVKWILGDLTVGDIGKWEQVHLRNVVSDVVKAKAKILS